jgi:hypothetical protein
MLHIVIVVAYLTGHDPHYELLRIALDLTESPVVASEERGQSVFTQLQTQIRPDEVLLFGKGRQRLILSRPLKSRERVDGHLYGLVFGVRNIAVLPGDARAGLLTLLLSRDDIYVSMNGPVGANILVADIPDLQRYFVGN